MMKKKDPRQIGREIVTRLHNANESRVIMTRDDFATAGDRLTVRKGYIDGVIEGIKEFNGSATESNTNKGVYTIHAPEAVIPSYTQITEASKKAEREGVRVTNAEQDTLVITTGDLDEKND